jgi:hypothetical protein
MTSSAYRATGAIAVAVALAATSSESIAQAVSDEFVIKLEGTACFGE